MTTKIQLKMTVTVEVDLPTWAETYGVGPQQADVIADAASYVQGSVEDDVRARLHTVANGARLVDVGTATVHPVVAAL